MKKYLIIGLAVFNALLSYAQTQVADTTATATPNVNNVFRNTLYTSKLGQAQIGGYAQIDYNQEVNGPTMSPGKMDVHRMIIFLGHQFNKKVSFFSEVEIEHVKEIYVEQAFLEYKVNDWMNVRGGLLLVPMSIVNEYHEPPTFNGVERPNLNKYIVPTTWREMGIGVAGSLKEISLNYQLYAMNGFLGYDGGEAKFRGTDGLRKGRQKGAESAYTGNVNIAGKLNYFAIKGLNIGYSTYFGKSQSTAFAGLERNDSEALESADSTVIGIAMNSLDFRYRNKDFTARGEFVYASLDNTDQYNAKGGKDLGSSMLGYYGELAYNVFGFMNNWEDELFVFGRYEKYNTHNSVKEMEVNKAYDRTDITVGLHYKPSSRASFKIDFQEFIAADGSAKSQINLGVGAWF